MSYTFQTKKGTAATVTIPVSADTTGATLTVEFAESKTFRVISLTKTPTGSGKSVVLSLTAAEVDSLTDSYYRVKYVKAGTTAYIQDGVVDYIEPPVASSPSSGAAVNAAVMMRSATKAAAARAGMALRPGSWYYPISPAASGTSNTLGNGSLRISEFEIASTTQIVGFFIEVTVAGEAGSTFRAALYRDELGAPTEVVGEAVIATNVVGVREAALDVVLKPGRYWIGGAVQNAATTQPTLRTISTPLLSPPNNALPAAGAAFGVGLAIGSITGALPAWNKVWNSSAGAAARVGIRVGWSTRPGPLAERFDAAWDAYGLTQYATVHNPSHVTLVDDPALGSARTVLKMETHNTDTSPTANPRTQVDTDQILRPGEDLWFGFGLYLPASWPNRATDSVNDFQCFAEVFGSPFTGSSPFSIVQRGNKLVATRNVNNAWDQPWAGYELPREKWVDIALHFKLSTDPAVGFYEVWINDGAGWTQQTFTNGSKRLMMATIDSSNGTPGTQRADIKNYRKVDVVMTPLTCYFAGHRVGQTLVEVDPRSHG